MEVPVSILVLLEVPLRPAVATKAKDLLVQVSILVLLEVPLRPNTDRLRAIAELEFQSLFCWKFLLGTFSSIAISPYSSCFNPCFVGSSS